MLYKRMNRSPGDGTKACTSAGLFLLMSVLSKALLTLVRCHFVFLSFLSARHMNVLIFFPHLTGRLKFLFQVFQIGINRGLNRWILIHFLHFFQLRSRAFLVACVHQRNTQEESPLNVIGVNFK